MLQHPSQANAVVYVKVMRHAVVAVAQQCDVLCAMELYGWHK